ncbi:BlaI/MecI/CopY family transcriptional regulator [Sulfidibacter corallicola]|uniref:BlaI/MecI/CopY family transcriptional regulator n=1 Tax=Sulfidibacter corallicola TaxID=2818388 RepID=A0A8A4TSD6_SULCO|nr:BlaI/MecI/CopY family transcriptional regulator [Sulfidibacter corallicola]QTD51941.1 BlaI/MecI/CopY family transcriptional regulator [Sulfidibacter corallicola]
MPRKKQATFTDGELRIMDVLWNKGSASVREVTEELSQKQKTAYTTVMTMLGVLRDKGYVAHEKQGRAFIYFPLVDRMQARRTALSDLLKRFFDGSPTLLMQNLLDDERLNEQDLAALKNRIEHFQGDES